MSLQISPWGNSQFLDTNGDPASGYQLFVYAGRTTTKLPIYTDVNGLGQHTNPIILDTNGMPPFPIYIDTSLAYKFILTPPDDFDPPSIPLYTVDMVSVGLQLPATASPEWISGTTPTYLSGTSFSVVGDQRSVYHVGRRVKALTNGGTFYGTITSNSLSTNTTVNVAWDSGSIDNTISAVYYGFLSASGSSWPSGFNNGLTTQLNGPLIVPVTAAFNLLSVGTVMPFAGTVTPPAGYLKCDGSAVSRTTYAALFGAIGTVFGTGDGSTTFNLPNVSNLATGIGYVIRYA